MGKSKRTPLWRVLLLAAAAGVAGTGAGLWLVSRAGYLTRTPEWRYFFGGGFTPRDPDPLKE